MLRSVAEYTITDNRAPEVHPHKASRHKVSQAASLLSAACDNLLDQFGLPVEVKVW